MNNTTQLTEINQHLSANIDDMYELWYRNAEIGKRLHIIKENFDGDTKKFGSYLAQHCPNLDVKLVSYYIKLAGYNTDKYDSLRIRNWLTDKNVNATNPRSCWDKFNNAHKTPKPDAEVNGEVTEIIPKPDAEVNGDGEVTEIIPDTDDSTPKDSLVARLAQLYSEFEKRAVDLDETDLDTIGTIGQQFSEFVASLI